MKALTSVEIKKLVFQLNIELQGAQLQNVILSHNLLILGFYQVQEKWLVLDMSPLSPQLALLPSISELQLKSETRPILLFLKAHLSGHRVQSVNASTDFGRVIVIKFPHDREMEIRLFPRGQNIIIKSEGKIISLHKQQELKFMESQPSVPDDNTAGVLEAKSKEWLSTVKASGQYKQQNKTLKLAGEFSNEKEKLLKAIGKIKEDITLKEKKLWRATGEWIVVNQSLRVPKKYIEYVDMKLSLAENMERCFSKAKDLERKVEKSKIRMSELESQINHLPLLKNISGKHDQLLDYAKARGRTLRLSNGCTFYVGKSAQDNARMLRAAKSWFLWFHLREVPGCHGFLTRNKSQSVSDITLHEAARFMLECQYGRKISEKNNEKFDFVVTECRFVRSIKGAKPGFVTYSQSRTITHHFKLDK